ncbi:DNA-dependent RNA polymerase auxiliary subunit epsilon family protein [Lactobacillus sp. LC28-10]|uniref:DNA-directed RNA polymerase subunit epsilon n=1 Tax=Secundilactobacillus angelensis TaxID=2722706 RepID=A0ABX1KX26_9LACO|nr:DNA-directed RNA polymerase subunit epsilon [Secundilactobacillus angelensis]MCH5461140.1 DNA-dependent RNA polymerase auxiliary subunit epsilon family protein [Secundilactobacillus angelensis]NLR17664.1 DNA-dependent RNA polymerase auxiliary subunit epsilon family protein [Secundilactobacillus angelensis]
MIFKVYYQEDQIRNPKREDTKSLYIDAATEVEARALVAENTDHNIEFIEPLEGKFLEYEQENPDYKLTEFNK